MGIIHYFMYYVSLICKRLFDSSKGTEETGLSSYAFYTLKHLANETSTI